jgi:hypothetical protein
MLDRKYLFLVGITIITLLVTVSRQSYAQDASEFLMTPPEEKKIIMYDEYSFIEQRYDPPYELPLTSNYKQIPQTTPENLITVDFSALLNSDFILRLNLQPELEKKNYEKKPNEEKETETALLMKQTETLLKGNKVVLERKISTYDGSYNILDYSIFKNGKKILSWFSVFVLEKNSWKICRECSSNAEHPVHIILSNFRFTQPEKIVTELELNTSKPSSPQFKFKEKLGKICCKL